MPQKLKKHMEEFILTKKNIKIVFFTVNETLEKRIWKL